MLKSRNGFESGIHEIKQCSSDDLGVCNMINKLSLRLGICWKLAVFIRE